MHCPVRRPVRPPHGIAPQWHATFFTDVDRLPIVIEMIVADTAEEREEALSRLLPLQRADFQGLFEVMAPNPVTIRLLDPPIHEFLPAEEQLEREITDLRHLAEVTRGMTVLAGAMSLIHASETAEQVRNSVAAYDMSPIEFLDHRGRRPDHDHHRSAHNRWRDLHGRTDPGEEELCDQVHGDPRTRQDDQVRLLELLANSHAGRKEA